MKFHFRPVLTISTCVGLVLLVGLGTWQLQRRAWKLDLIQMTQTRIGAAPINFNAADKQQRKTGDAEYLPVFSTGVFRHELEAHVFGTLDGVPGYYVFTPLALNTDRQPVRAHIYINRGFVPQAQKDVGARQQGLISGPVEVKGLYRSPQQPRGLAKTFRPEDLPEKNQWFRRDPAAFARVAGIAAAAGYIDSSGAENPGDWPKGGTTRLDFRNVHLEYALTWFGLAGALFAVWLAFSRQRK